MTNPQTSELVEAVRDFIYELTSDEFQTGWAPSQQQAQDLIALATRANDPLVEQLVEALEVARDTVHAAYCDNAFDSSAPEHPGFEMDEGKAPIHCEECREATAALDAARERGNTEFPFAGTTFETRAERKQREGRGK